MDDSQDLENQPNTASEDELLLERPFPIPPQVGNLVPLLLDAAETDDRVKKFINESLPAQILEHFDEDWKGREAWMAKRKDRVKLYIGDVEKPRAPFENVASMHSPILLERILRMAFRIFGEIFKDREPIARALPSSNVNKEKADLITLVDHWQFTREITDFQAQVMRLIIMYLRDGDCVMDSFYDDELGVNRHEALSPEEVVFPYTMKSTAIDMSDIPRKTKILYKYKRDIKNLETIGAWHHVDRIVRKDDGSFENEIDQPIRDLMDKYEGKDRTDSKADAPYTFLEYRGWALFPGHERELPIRAIMHYHTKTVVALLLRQHDDPIDRMRFEKQTAEYQKFVGEFHDFLEVQRKEQELLAAMQMPGVDPNEALAVATGVEAQTPAAPIPPKWMQFDEAGAAVPPDPCKQIPIEMMAHASCIENPDGSMGLGVGALLMPFQESVNILMNQFVQAAVLANSKSGILHESVKLEPGVKDIGPNEILRASGSLQAFKDGWMPMQAQPANPQLLAAIEMQVNAADGVSNAPDVLSGGKEGPETYRGQATRLEQAVNQLSVVASNLVRMLAQVFRNNAKLNSQFMPEEKIMAVLDPTTMELRENVRVGRELYQDSYEVQFTADLRFASHAAKIAEADDVLGMFTKGIPGELAPQIVDLKMFAAVVRNCLKARGQYDLLKYVKTDEQIDAETQQKQMAAQQAAMMQQQMQGGQPGGGPTPSVPTGTPNRVPGGQAPGQQMPRGTPEASAPRPVQ